MEEFNEIDKLFREGTEKEIPFDENLWAAVESQLPKPIYKRGFFSLNSILVGVIIFLCSLIPKDNSFNKALTVSRNTNPMKVNAAKSPAFKTESNKNVKENLRVNETIEEVPSLSKTNTDQTETKINSAGKPINSIEKQKNNSSVNPSLKETEIPVIAESNSQNYNKENELKLSEHSLSPSFSEGKEKLLSYNLIKMDIAGLKEMSAKASLLPLTVENKKLYRKRSLASDISVELAYNTSFNERKRIKSGNNSFDMYKVNNEKEVSTNSLGLNFKKQKRFITYGAGLHMRVYKERVNYLLKEEALQNMISYDTTYQVVNGDFNSNGNPVLLIKRNVTEVRSSRVVLVDNEFSAFNTFTRLSLPVFIGFQKDYKRLLFEVRSSFSTNYAIQQEGYYINDNLDEVSNVNDNKTLKSLYFSHLNSAGMGYALNERMLAGVRFSYEYDITSFTENYNSKLTSQSVGIWLMFKP